MLKPKDQIEKHERVRGRDREEDRLHLAVFGIHVYECPWCHGSEIEKARKAYGVGGLKTEAS